MPEVVNGWVNVGDDQWVNLWEITAFKRWDGPPPYVSLVFFGSQSLFSWVTVDQWKTLLLEGKGAVVAR